MGSIGSIENLNIALQVQATMQRKLMDYQAESFLKLLEGVKEVNEAVNGGRNDSLGNVVDVIV
jgi:hypothetical protein